MTVENPNVRNTYAGNGSTTVFPFTFAINVEDAQNVVVLLTDPEGRETRTMDFVLSLNNKSVRYPKSTEAPPLPAGWKITLRRAIPYTQSLNLTSQGAFFAEDVEGQFDRQEMQIQQLAEVAERAVTVGYGADITPEQFKQDFFDASKAAVASATEARNKASAAAQSEKNAADSRNSAAESARTAVGARDDALLHRDAASTSAQHAAASSSAAERSREAAAASEVHTRDMERSVRSMQTHIEGIDQNITSAKTAVETLHRGAREAASSASEKASSAAKSADSAAASAEKAQQAARMEGIVESKHLADGAVTPPKIGFTAGDINAYTKGEINEKFAPLASPALTGTPTAPTAVAGTNNTQIASTAFVAQAIAALVNSSPDALDTLQELAAALGNDANFAATITNALASKVSKSGDTMTGRLTVPSVIVNDWFRTTGSCGLYFEDRGGGWYMTDSDWIRAFNGKHIYTSGKMRCDGGFEGALRGKADSAGNSDNLGGQSLQWILNQIGAAKTGIIAGNLAQNGWVKFANGLILQWGTVPPIQKNSVAFPIAFPAACFSVHCNNASESLYTNTYKHTVVTFKIGKTGFSYAFDDASAPVQWMAIGY